MTEFVQAAHPTGILFLPRDVVPAVPEFDIIDELTDLRRRKAELDAHEARLLARLYELRDGDRYVPDEAALELRISVNAAGTRIAHSIDLVHRMPNVLQALQDGEIDGYTAGRLTDICRTLSDENAREVDLRWGAKRDAGTLNFTDPVKIRRATQRLALSVDPTAAVTSAKAARNERKVQLIPAKTPCPA